MIRVIVADDHALVREGICALLERAGGIQVVAVAADGMEAVAKVAEHLPDVLLVDISMERLNGIQATEQIRQRGLATRIVVLSMYSDKHLIQQAFRAGVKGYLLKSAIEEELLLAVRSAFRGHSFLSPEISDAIVSSLISDEPLDQTTPLAELTPREQEILKLVAEGLTSSGIAELLQVSVKTVQKHRANLMSKLNVRNTASLTQVAIKYGLVHIE